MAVFKFTWLKTKRKDWAVQLTAIFTWPSAGGDRCLNKECGVERRHHSLGKDGHRFVEKAP